MELFYADIIGIDPAPLKPLPIWQARLQAAHTLLREGQAVANYMPDRKALSAVRTPTRLLTGDTSPPPFGAAAREAAESIPGADLVTLPG